MSDDNEPSTFKRYLVKPATIGAVGAGMSKYMLWYMAGKSSEGPANFMLNGLTGH